MLKNIIILLSFFLFLSSCASLPDRSNNNELIVLNSFPQGADIIVSNNIIGTTPLKISPDEHFPARWYGINYMVSGKLKFSKAGCTDYIMLVSDPILLNNINVTLKCNPNFKPSSTDKITAPISNNQSTPVTNRLNRIKALLNSGDISEAEYESIRQRILKSL